MNASDPQFIYLVLILPTLFGLTLIGDGANKIYHHEQSGIIGLMIGFVFLTVVGIAFVFFAIYLK